MSAIRPKTFAKYDRALDFGHDKLKITKLLSLNSLSNKIISYHDICT